IEVVRPTNRLWQRDTRGALVFARRAALRSLLQRMLPSRPLHERRRMPSSRLLWPPTRKRLRIRGAARQQLTVERLRPHAREAAGGPGAAALELDGQDELAAHVAGLAELVGARDLVEREDLRDLDADVAGLDEGGDVGELVGVRARDQQLRPGGALGGALG